MAEDLGTVRVNIEEEGAQEAADTIGDAVGEGMSDGAGPTSGQQGGGAGILGGISTKLAAILGLVTFLASLKPIQELLSGIQRFFSVALLPLVALLTSFLRPVLQDLLRFIANFDFDNVVDELLTKLPPILSDLAEQIGDSIANILPFVNESQTERPTAITSAGQQAALGGPTFEDGEVVKSPTDRLESTFPLNVVVDFFNEQSNTTLESNSANTNSEVIGNQGLGYE